MRVWKRGSENCGGERVRHENAGSGEGKRRKKHVDSKTQPEQNKNKGVSSFDILWCFSYVVFNLNILPRSPCCSRSPTRSLHAPPDRKYPSASWWLSEGSTITISHFTTLFLKKLNKPLLILSLFWCVSSTSRFGFSWPIFKIYNAFFLHCK